MFLKMFSSIWYFDIFTLSRDRYIDDDVDMHINITECVNDNKPFIITKLWKCVVCTPLFDWATLIVLNYDALFCGPTVASHWHDVITLEVSAVSIWLEQRWWTEATLTAAWPAAHAHAHTHTLLWHHFPGGTGGHHVCPAKADKSALSLPRSIINDWLAPLCWRCLLSQLLSSCIRQ